MIAISDFDKEKESVLVEIVIEFNRLYKAFPKTITGFSYYELWEKSELEYDVLEWRIFYNDPRVRRWYATELDLAVDSKIHKLIREAGTNNSTATQQTLTSLLRHKEDNIMEADEGKIFVYTHWPLTQIEEHLPNVTISEAIPKEINSAISVFTRN